jgi:hypothetical protein
MFAASASASRRILALDSIKLEERSSMASIPVPEEAASHLGAILLAFNREIFGSFLDEADELAELGQANSALLIAGTVLEYFERSPAASALPHEHRIEIAEWRQLRNQAAHGAAGAISVQQAKQVIDGVRQILMSDKVSGESVRHLRPADGAHPHAIKGKYAHVPTSSDDFIKRKHKELDLEDRG